ncbi:MAG: ATP-dependent helicase/nuclease subunit A, partial [Acidimicrobiales bacterium]
LFGSAIGNGELDAQPAYTPLDAHREPNPEVPDAPAVVVLGGPSDLTALELRQAEAVDIAAFVCRAVAEERLVFREDQWRPARLQDIAILIPSRLSLPALESAFTAVNVPFRPETSSLVYATQEVRDVLAGVRAVVDPASSVDVVAALRSALFSIDDDELLSWRLDGGSWDYRILIDDPLGERRIARAYQQLHEWHEQRWWTEPSQLVEQIVRTRRLREQALASSRPRDRWRRYRFLAEQARQFTALQGGDLHDFVRWVEIQSSDLARITEPIPAETDDDAVRILTVHGSKGLEFPITVLAGASTEERSRNTGPTVLFADDGEPQVKLGKDRVTAGFDVHASVEEVLDRHERVRLHYVAATRARDVLVVSAHHKERSISMGRRTNDVLDDCPDLWERFETAGDEIYDARPPTQLRLGATDYYDEVAVWMEERRRLLQHNRQAVTVSATGLAKQVADSHAVDLSDARDVDFDVERRPWRRGRAGTAIGSAVHAVLQHVDLETGAGLEGLARLHAEREGVGHLAERVVELATAALSAPTVLLTRTHRFWRELHVAVPTGAEAGGVLEGYVDLLVETDDGLIVVDFKTDPVRSDADVDRLLDNYRIQGASYAVALAEITNQPIVDCRFLFLAEQGVIERSIVDLSVVMDEVRQQLAPAS